MRQISNVHDKFFQETFTREEIAKSFLKNYLPKSVLAKIDLDKLTIVKDSFVDKELREHFSDILYIVRYQDSELYIYLLFEHKSHPEPMVGLQILRYMVRIWEQYLKKHPKARKVPAVFPIVFYHGRTKWNVPENFQSIVENYDGSNEFCKYIPEFSYKLYDISNMPDSEIRGEVVGRLVLYIAKYVFRPELKERLPEFLSLLYDVANRKTASEILEVLLRYVVQATGDFDEEGIRDIVQKTAIGEDIMQTFIDKYINQGIEKGLQQGVLQGVQQGVQQGEMKILLRMMESRFGKLPRWVKAKIGKADTGSIEKWSIRLLRADTVEDVLGV